MGCKYNLEEFKPFVSGKKKIIPALVNDWELTLESFSRASDVSLYSKKLDTKIYDLQFKPFLKFLKEENVTMVGDKIQGTFIIGKQRVSDYLETIALKKKDRKWNN